MAYYRNLYILKRDTNLIQTNIRTYVLYFFCIKLVRVKILYIFRIRNVDDDDR